MPERLLFLWLRLKARLSRCATCKSWCWRNPLYEDGDGLEMQCLGCGEWWMLWMPPERRKKG